MDDTLAVLQAALEAQSQELPAALATVVEAQGSVPRHAGSKMLVREDGSIVGTVGGGAMEALVIKEAILSMREGTPRTRSYTLNDIQAGDPGVCGGTVQVFIEPLIAVPRILVIGMGHVGKALAELARWMGFYVAICDDREAYCNPGYLPDMDEYVVCKPADVIDQARIDRNTYVAAVTRGMPVDLPLIPALLATEAAYIGLIGSRRRWTLTAKALKAERMLDDEALRRVYSPIGLELQAETPREIAISIMAQIIMLRRGGSGQPMQWLDEEGESE
ncbi:MAG: XdhC family protein [Anaerolineae bacterium]|nr:XdhC family protein [Anaerolineae bacterium]